MTAHARPLLSADNSAWGVQAREAIAAIEAILAASTTRGDVTESCDGPRRAHGVRQRRGLAGRPGRADGRAAEMGRCRVNCMWHEPEAAYQCLGCGRWICGECAASPGEPELCRDCYEVEGGDDAA